MKRRSSKGEFELEALEARVLLDASLLPVPSAPIMASTQNAVSADESSPAIAPATSAIAYDPAAQIDTIFGAGVAADSGNESAGSVASEDEDSQEGIPANTDAEGNSNQRDNAPTDETLTATTSSSSSESTVAQLTETLHVANAPPSQSFDGKTGDVIAVDLQGFGSNFGDLKLDPTFSVDPVTG